MRIIRRKYPAYDIESLTTLYSDWSSTIRETDKYNKATMAKAIISGNDETRTLHFKLRYRMWHITHDAPDGGRNVPDGEYYMEDNVAAVGKRIDINESVKHSWVIPDENGELYHKVGTDENWYYSYHYIRNIYKTGDGGVRLRTEEGCRIEAVYVEDGNDVIILDGEFNQIVIDTDAPVILENVQAEVLDVILSESMESGAKVFEIDCSELTPTQVADRIERIVILGETNDSSPGNVDWSGEMEEWF